MAVRVEEWSMILMANANNLADAYRQLIPTDRGTSIHDQIYPWSMDGLKEKMEQPLPAHKVDPETISNLMNMMAVEAQHWMDYLHFARMTNDPKAKSLFNDLARAEHVHHLRLMSLLPVPHSPSELTLEGEVSLMTTYGLCIDREANQLINGAFFHMFQDHQQHAEFAAANVQKAGCDVNTITGGADLSGGRPVNEQFMRPGDTIWNADFNGSYSKFDVDPMTLINVDMALAGELAMWQVYHCAMTNESDMNNKANFAAFQSVESQHAAILSSIKDPSETPLERALVHEAVEISMYAMLRDQEANPQAKQLFADLFNEDLEQGYQFGQNAR